MYVLPLPVWPYANSVALNPASTDSVQSRTCSYMSACVMLPSITASYAHWRLCSFVLICTVLSYAMITGSSKPFVSSLPIRGRMRMST